ncbi:MAG: glycosyltransferase [Vicinamibacterales bacterium]
MRERFVIKGVAYGTFAPDRDGVQFPAPSVVANDFARMAAAGINTVRTYTVPPEWLFDEAARHGLRLMAGIPWAQHVAFLDDKSLARQVRREAVDVVRRLGAHPAALLFAVGNEIPPSVVRWHGQARVERFLRELAGDVKGAAPEALLTYVNFPPTEFLDLSPFDVCAFNVYLHREADLRAYLARLQHIAGNTPLLLAEAGADSIREGLDGQARITAMHLRTAFAEGACGAVAFSWTDEWWRGGHDVRDWAFGLVDAARQPKPALAAVEQAFAEAPFSARERATWPKVSVIVCGYNAADTLPDCFDSLAKLTYPDVEILFVNDGSRDQSSEIARRYPSITLIEIPNGGLSAARNVGLAAATGELVAYTDADVRVDPDWLTYLVQPFLTSDVVGSGGPNVIPADDPWVAQCVARAPGGPTQVLLDDRIAEHVPGCNMAFRRDALLAIGGFNPVYLRAGDDVDVCWRLQARGQRIGFAPAALVWHHHRASVKAYWRQQVGYGEGETWLDAHHPEKFIGGQMLWRGRIYSPLPFVRSLACTRINFGVWGTASFPSVYSTDVHPAQFLPHSPGWMLGATLMLLAGFLGMASPFVGATALLLAAGSLGWAVTIGRCFTFALRSDLPGATVLGGTGLGGTRVPQLRTRLLIAWLHVIQPVARLYGRVRGMLSPPPSITPEHVTRVPWKAPMPSLRDAGRALLLLIGGTTERDFWSEQWASHPTLLTEIGGVLRAARPAPRVETDDGWHADRDVSVGVGRWGWVHIRALVEEHAQGRCLLRVAMRLRPSFAGIVFAVLSAVALVAITSAVITVLRGPIVSLICVSTAAAVFSRGAWQTMRAVAVMERALLRVTGAAGMTPLPLAGEASGRRIRLRPASASQLLQTAVVTFVVASAVVSVIFLQRSIAAREAFRLEEAARAATAALLQPQLRGGVAVTATNDLYVADAVEGLIRRYHVRVPGTVRTTATDAAPARQMVGTPLPFDAAADLAMASNGDLLVADPANHRICRIERTTGRVVTIAGTGGEGFDSEARQAAQSPLRRPEAIAVDRRGDLFIADTRNNRIRLVSQDTGLISTVAGTGEPNGPAEAGAHVGDGGPATDAYLDAPAGVAIADNGDIYLADTGHDRVRRVDAATGIITTVAAIDAPTGLTLRPTDAGLVVYVIDSRARAVRSIAPDGTVSTVATPDVVRAPTRLAYHRSGWLYVKDASPTGITVVAVPLPEPIELAVVPSRRKPA